MPSLKNWEESSMVEYASIGSLLKRKRNKAKSINCAAPVYAVTNSNGFVLSSSLHEFTIHSEDTSNYMVVEKNDFAYNPSRLNIGSIAYFKHEAKGLISPMYVVFHADERKVLPEYLYVVIKSQDVGNKIDSLKEVGARFRFDFSRWDLIQIPIPSLSEQERIVGMLDTFTSAIDNLKEQIVQRRKQYEHYRDELLDLEGKPGVEMKTLGDVARYYRGVTYNKNQEVALNSGGTKIFRANNINLGTNTLNYDDVKEISKDVRIRDDQWLYKDDILICAGSGSKEHVGKVAYIKQNLDYAYGGFMGKIVTDDTLDSGYLFHVISSTLFKDYLKIALNSTTINNLNSTLVNNFLFPIPSLSEQERIVGMLDTFTKSIANLEAQLKEREKQYEYYRNKLLTFEK